jgi:hypothetical protein
MIPRRSTKASAAADKRVTAHHEAGHGCAAIALRIPFRSIDIIENDSGSGHITPRAHKKTVDFIERRCICLFAGPLAQRRYAPSSGWLSDLGFNGYREWDLCYGDDLPPGRSRVLKTSMGSDLSHIQVLLAALGRGNDYAYFAELEARARDLVCELWPQIKIVAAALLRHKVLSERQVRKLLADARKDVS